jgi:hypothetical protein
MRWRAVSSVVGTSQRRDLSKALGMSPAVLAEITEEERIRAKSNYRD